MAYSATIAAIQSVEKHPNADKIQLAKVLGEQVVVGLETKVGDVGIYFPVDGQLSHDFCDTNDLYNNSARMSLGLGDGKTGFFDVNRRVRAQSFRGQKSEGFWLPVTPAFLADANLAVGVSLTEINGHQICQKYVTKATREAVGASGNRRVKRGETLMFPKHYDTDQFRHKWEEIPEGSIIYLTEKLHGTSGRFGHVIDETEQTLLGKAAAKVLALFSYYRKPWTTLSGTRNVVVEHSDGTGFYGDDKFRYEHVKDVKLRKGEVIFFELVGDVSAGKPIMAECAVDKKELPEIFNQYGPTMRYRYGCAPGENKLYVYRICQFNEDGEAVDLPWPQVKKRCGQLGLAHVPEIGVGEFDPCDENYGQVTSFFWRGGAQAAEYFKKHIEDASHGPSLLDPTHIREGVAVRIEDPNGRIYCLKEKSYEFKFLEGIVKSNDSYVDTEEAA